MIKKELLEFTRPEPTLSYTEGYPKYWTIKITRLCLGLSRLDDHKYKHNFQDYACPVVVVMILKHQPNLYVSHLLLYSRSL